MKPRALALATLALGLPLFACQFLVGIEERYVADGGPDATLPDSGPDVGRDTAGRDTARPEDSPTERALPTCLGAQPPPPPKRGSMTGFDGGEFLVAVQSIWYDTATVMDAGADAATDSGITLGYNLDHECTCEGTPKGPPSCVNDAMVTCDGLEGRDLAGNALLAMVDDFGASTVAQLFNSKIASGQVTAMLRVAFYNLGADDQAVTLSTFVAGGLPSDAGIEAGFSPPKWDGTDRWTVDPRSVATSSFVDGGWQYFPLFVDTAAYVSDYTLVAKLSALHLGIGQADLSLTDAVMVAKLEPDGTTGGYMLTGQIAGRLAVSTIFALASTFPDPSTEGGAFCGNDLIFTTLIQPTVCQATDIMGHLSQDNTGKGCDALSLGIGFVARKVLLGAPYRGVNPVVGCDGSVATCKGVP